MIIEIASMPKTATQGFVKSLYVIIFFSLNENLPPALKKQFREWTLAAQPFVKQFQLVQLNALAKSVLAGRELEDEDTHALGVEMKEAFQSIVEERDIGHHELAVIKSAGSWFRIGSEGAYRRLEKSVSSFNEPLLNAQFTEEVGSQKPAIKALNTLVKKLTGKPHTNLPVEKALGIKQKHPELYKEYNRLRREFNGVWKDALKTLVRKSGESTVDIKDAIKFFKENNLQYTLPNGFVGRIDDQGKLYTTTGKLINGVPNIMFPNVEMNPNYDPKADDSWVFMAVKANGEKGNYFYTTSYRKQANQQKFMNVDQLKTQIKGIRNKWLPFMRKGVDTYQGVASTILEILLQYSARIGSKGNEAAGSPTYGIATLTCSHVKPVQGGLALTYKGKDGVSQRHVIKPTTDPIRKIVYQNLLQLIKGKKPSENVFTFPGIRGGNRIVTGSMVNRFFRALGAKDVTIHKLRTLRGTMLFQKLMDDRSAKLFERKMPMSEKQAREEFMKIAVEVGKALGHVRNTPDGTKFTGATALNSYIEPGILLSYWQKAGYRPPKFLEKLLHPDPNL